MDTLYLDVGTVDLIRGTVQRSDGATKRLSDLEIRLLTHLRDRGGSTATRAELMSDVWGYHPDTASRTLDVAIRRLRRKIEVDSSAPAHLQTVYGEGYRLSLERSVAPASERLPPPAALLGRDDDLARLKAALHTHPATALVGPVGVGKTLLARHALLDWPDDVIWCTGDGAASSRAVAARVLRVRGEPVERALAGRPGVLVLDGFRDPTEVEPLIGLGPSVLWLTRTLPPEQFETVHLAPLPAETACELLLRSARRLRPELELDPAILSRLAERLDGLPLALQVVGRRLALAPAASILQSLETEGVAIDAVDQAVDQALRDLDPRTVQLAHALALWRGAFSLEQARAVFDAPVEDGIARLLERALLTTAPGARFRMLGSFQDSLRPGATDAHRERYARVVSQLGVGLRRLDGSEGKEALAELTTANADLRAALQWALAAADAEIAARCCRALLVSIERAGGSLSPDLVQAVIALRPTSEIGARFWGAVARTRSGAPREEAWNAELELARAGGWVAAEVEALVGLARIFEVDGRFDRAMSLFEQAMERAEAGEDPMWIAHVLLARAHTMLLRREPIEDLLNAAMTQAVAAGNRRQLALARRMLARPGRQGLPLDAEEQLVAAAELYVELGDRGSLAFSKLTLGDLYLRTGQLRRAESSLREALQLALTVGDRLARAWSTVHLARVQSLQGRYGAAAVLHEDVEHLAIALDNARLKAILAEDRAHIALERGRPSQARAEFERAGALYGALNSPSSLVTLGGNLAEVSLAEGDVEGAIEAARAAAGQLDHHPGAQGAILGVLAEAMARRDDPAALQVARQAERLLRDQAEWYELALLYVRCLSNAPTATPEFRQGLTTCVERMELSRRSWLARKVEGLD